MNSILADPVDRTWLATCYHDEEPMKILWNVMIAALVITLSGSLSALHAQPFASTSSTSIAVGAVVADCSAVTVSGSTALTAIGVACGKNSAVSPEIQQCLSSDDYRCANALGTDRVRTKNLRSLKQLYF